MVYTNGEYIHPFSEKIIHYLIEIVKRSPSVEVVDDMLTFSEPIIFSGFDRSFSDDELDIFKMYRMKFKHVSNLDESIDHRSDIEVAITCGEVDYDQFFDHFIINNFFYLEGGDSLILITSDGEIIGEVSVP